MKEIVHTIPEEYLNEIVNSPTKRHARILAGWLNRSHGNTKENRRAIQNTISAKKTKTLVNNNDRGKNENHI